MTRPLDRSFIEHIHDVLVATVLPFDEKILPNEYRDRALIESAAGRPFQTAFGEEAYPTLAAKAAALFHALVCNHCFFNGNKRTAVISLDLFLIINKTLLFMTSDEVYEMAKMTAKANEDGRPLSEVMDTLIDRIGRAALDMNRLRELLSAPESNVPIQLAATSLAQLQAHLNLLDDHDPTAMDHRSFGAKGGT